MTATFYVEVPPLEARALADGGRELIEYIAERERKNLPTSNTTIARFMHSSRREHNGVAGHLVNANLLRTKSVLHTTNVAKPGNLTLYELTSQAWRMVGNRPLWHTEE